MLNSQEWSQDSHPVLAPESKRPQELPPRAGYTHSHVTRVCPNRCSEEQVPLANVAAALQETLVLRDRSTCHGEGRQGKRGIPCVGTGKRKGDRQVGEHRTHVKDWCIRHRDQGRKCRQSGARACFPV